MKIIKRGSPVLGQETCKNCESVLEYNENDLSCEQANPQRYIECPVCREKVYPEINKINSAIKEMGKEERMYNYKNI